MGKQIYPDRAWAIDTRSPEGHGYAGVGYRMSLGDMPSCCAVRTALFQTRREARKVLPRVKLVFPRAKVVRVALSMRSLEK